MMLHANPSERYLAIVRAVVFLLVAVKFAFDPLHLLSDLPSGGFAPPTPLRWLPTSLETMLLNESCLQGLRVAGVLLSIACIFPAGLQYAGAFCCASFTLHQLIVRGFGHTNHAEIALLLSTYILAFGAWVPRPRVLFEPFFITLTLLTTYMLTSVYRIAYGGLGVFTSDSIIYWSVENSVRTACFDFDWGLLLLQSPWAWPWMKASFVMITIIELLAPWAILSNMFRWFFLFSILAFQTAVVFSMNILFFDNIVLLILLLSPRNALSLTYTPLQISLMIAARTDTIESASTT